MSSGAKRKRVEVRKVMYDRLKQNLSPKELATYFLADTEYLNLYCRYRITFDEEKKLIRYILDGHTNIDDIKKVFNQVLNRSLFDICAEMMKMQGTRYLYKDIIHFFEPYRGDMIDAIIKQDIDAMYKLIKYPNHISNYLFDAYHHSSTNVIKHICQNESTYVTYANVLIEKNYALFELMISYSENFDKESLIVLVGEKRPEALDHVFKLKQFSYYLTEEGILGIIKKLKDDSHCFKIIVNHPNVPGKVLDNILNHIPLDRKKDIKEIIITRKCNEETLKSFTVSLQIDELINKN